MCLHGLDILSNVGVVFLPSVCDGFCVSVFSLGQGFEVFVTNCMDNPRSCSAGVDEMRVFEIVCILCADHVFWYPWFLCREFNSCVFPSFGLHANIVGSMCC